MIAYMIMKRRKQLRETNTLALFDAIANEDEMEAISIAEKHCDFLLLDYLHEEYGSLIYFTAMMNMSTLMTLLLQRDIDLELGKPDGTTALYIACELGHEEIVNQLLNAKANVEATHHRLGYTPLYAACYHGREQVVQELLLFHANVEASIASPTEDKPLHAATAQGHTTIVELLLQHRANVNAPLASLAGGVTCLHLACRHGYQEIVKVLLRHKAAINATKYYDGGTPLLEACEANEFECAQLLLEAGANTYLKFKDDNTVLHVATRHNNPKLVEILLQYRAESEAATSDSGDTPLHIAAREGYVEVAKMLVETFKAEVNVINKQQASPMYFAASNGHLEVVELLLQHNAQVVTGAGLWRRSAHTAASSDEIRDVIQKTLDEDMEALAVSGISLSKTSPSTTIRRSLSAHTASPEH